MPTETIEAPASQEPSAKAPTSDAKKSDNVKGPSVAHALLKREAALAAKKAPPVESVVEAAKAAEKTTPADAPKADASDTKAKEAVAEAKADAPEPKADDQEVLSKSIPPEVQESINKRIGKEIAKREALEAKLAELEKKLSDKPVELPKPTPVEPTPANPLANVTDLNALEKELKTAKETRRWVQDQLDRDDLDKGVSVGEKTYTKGELKAALRNVERLIEDAIPERARFLAARQQSEKTAIETFDWLKDTDSDQYKAFVKVMSDPHLGFASAPNGIYAAAAAVEGQSQVQLRRAIAEQSKGAKPVDKAKPQAPASQLASSGASSPVNREAGSSRAIAALQAEMERMKKGHGQKVSDVAKFLAKRDQTNR